MSKYRHLGGIIYHSGGVVAEARNRYGLTWDAFRRHQKAICRRCDVALDDKLQIFASRTPISSYRDSS